MDNKQQNLHVNEHEIEQRIDNLRFELDKIDSEIQKLHSTKNKLQDALALVRHVSGGKPVSYTHLTLPTKRIV